MPQADGRPAPAQLRTIRQLTQDSGASSFAFSFDANILAVGTSNGRIYLWDPLTAKELRRLDGHTNHVYSVAFSPDGKTLASGGQDYTFRLWDVATGNLVHWLTGHRGQVNGVAFSPDGRWIASAGQDKTVRLWEVASGTEAARYEGHQDAVRPILFAPNSRILASGSFDRTAALLDMTGLLQRQPNVAVNLSDKELEDLWVKLGDAAQESSVIWTLSAAPKQAVPFLQKKLPPADQPSADQQRITQLIADLDNDIFKVRERAYAELAKLGKQVEPALRAILARKPSLEVQRRVKALLDKPAETGISPAQLRVLRAVTVLEWIGTAEARRVLADLAKGTPGAWETEEAAKALQRLAERQPQTPLPQLKAEV